jgi:hypothetical protein
VVLGELHYCKELYGGLTMHTGAASFFLCDGFFAFMRTMKDRHIDIDESAFWSEYSIRRWSIPRNWREIAFSKDIHSIREIAKKFGEVNGKAQQQLGETMDPSEKIFLKNSGIYASRTSDVFIDLCPIDQQEGLLKIMFQAGFDALNGPGAGEVISVSRSRGNIIPRKRVRWSPHPHPNANPELAAKLNLKYQEEVARWKKLSWWKRIRTKPPTPPEAN